MVSGILKVGIFTHEIIIWRGNNHAITNVMVTQILRIVIARAIARSNPEKQLDCFAPLAMTA